MASSGLQWIYRRLYYIHKHENKWIVHEEDQLQAHNIFIHHWCNKENVYRASGAHNMATHHTPISSVFGGGLAGQVEQEWFTIDVLNSITYRNQAFIFEWYSFKNKYQTDTCLKDIGLRAQNMMIIIGSIINISEGTYMTI